MRIVRLGAIAVLAAGAWLGLGAQFEGGLPAIPPPAAAQGTLTPPAGQPSVTAPGGLRGRSARRRGFRLFHKHPHHRR
ncbi:hypothetical protein MKK67_17450 [Methylobacterium sp. J-072]|uniref:hypothetical protein n=1 Tax=Methylobacterium sp. J-072 TaxID=2836651 RepID=UPI001FBAA37C|nr:hypothetical protein [Methylobacterium sp. J-072]MCJ2094265.1 hypothetical protein [Methylobacterium sp. J-072]